MPPASDSQRVQLRNLLDGRSMMRAQELREAGISAQTIARTVETGEIDVISRAFFLSADTARAMVSGGRTCYLASGDGTFSVLPNVERATG